MTSTDQNPEPTPAAANTPDAAPAAPAGSTAGPASTAPTGRPPTPPPAPGAAHHTAPIPTAGPPPAAPGPYGPAPTGLGWKKPVAIAALVAVCFGCGVAGARVGGAWDTTNSTTLQDALSSSVDNTPASASAPTQTLAQVAAKVQPSVVSITVDTPQGQGEGSGIILREDGTILTNNHVIADAATDTNGPSFFSPNSGSARASIQVKFSDGKTARATIVGRDPSTDIAVIRAEAVSGLTPAQLASTSTLHVGDTVLALGSPLGLDGSVSAGIVSALHRPVSLGSADQQQGLGLRQPSAVTDAIQTDAAINPGNSGGALVDTQGRVVGVNSAIAALSGSSGNIGVGFAIPIEQATTVADALLAGKRPTHSLLGVQSSDDPQGRGAVVAGVVSGGPAGKAGLQPGDVITRLGDRTINDATGLSVAVRATKPGTPVQITYLRDGSSHTATATLTTAS